VIDDTVGGSDTGEAIWRSLLRITLALLAALVLLIGALHLTYYQSASPAVTIARVLLFPLLALAGVSWAAGVWRARTHVLAQATLIMLGFAVMPIAAFIYEFLLECDFVDHCS
jgi:hypothetical protein